MPLSATEDRIKFDILTTFAALTWRIMNSEQNIMYGHKSNQFLCYSFINMRFVGSASSTFFMPQHTKEMIILRQHNGLIMDQGDCWRWVGAGSGPGVWG